MRRHPVLPVLMLFLAWLLPAALALAAPPASRATPPAPVAGVDYVEIEGGMPWRPRKGQVEVAEVFGYWCHHCADFQPKVDAWKRTLPKDVRLSYVPLPSDREDPFARAFFAAEAAGVLDRTHAAMFRAIHAEGTLPKNPSIDESHAFHAARGVDAARLKAAMEAPGMVDRLVQARQFAIRSGVEGTPTLIVDGRYRVTGRTFEDTLRIAGQLVARQRAAARR